MQMSSFFSALALGSAALLAAQPAVAQQKLVPAQSEVQFTARQMGVPLEGHFKKFDAQVSFDPAKLATSKIVFTVDTGSATMGSRARPRCRTAVPESLGLQARPGQPAPEATETRLGADAPVAACAGRGAELDADTGAGPLVRVDPS